MVLRLYHYNAGTLILEKSPIFEEEKNAIVAAWNDREEIVYERKRYRVRGLRVGKPSDDPRVCAVKVEPLGYVTASSDCC